MANLPIPDLPPDVITSVPTGAGSHTLMVASLFASFIGWLPGIIAVLPAVYYLILIWESRTVQGWVHRVKSTPPKAPPDEPPAQA